MEHWDQVVRKKIEKTKDEFAVRYTDWKRFERIFRNGDFGNNECIVVDNISRALDSFYFTHNPNSRSYYLKKKKN